MNIILTTFLFFTLLPLTSGAAIPKRQLQHHSEDAKVGHSSTEDLTVPSTRISSDVLPMVSSTEIADLSTGLYESMSNEGLGQATGDPNVLYKDPSIEGLGQATGDPNVLYKDPFIEGVGQATGDPNVLYKDPSIEGLGQATGDSNVLYKDPSIEGVGQATGDSNVLYKDRSIEGLGQATNDSNVLYKDRSIEGLGQAMKDSNVQYEDSSMKGLEQVAPSSEMLPTMEESSTDEYGLSTSYFSIEDDSVRAIDELLSTDNEDRLLKGNDNQHRSLDVRINITLKFVNEEDPLLFLEIGTKMLTLTILAFVLFICLLGRCFLNCCKNIDAVVLMEEGQAPDCDQTDSSLPCIPVFDSFCQPGGRINAIEQIPPPAYSTVQDPAHPYTCLLHPHISTAPPYFHITASPPYQPQQFQSNPHTLPGCGVGSG